MAEAIRHGAASAAGREDAGGRPILVVTGATATGKTRLAIDLARRLDGEVVSMDSRQVYRDMDIGTAKPTAAERCGVAHHGFDLVRPDQRYSAGRFAVDARGWIAGILSRGRVPILAGGTGFFLRALTHPMFREPPMDAERRAALRDFLKGRATDELLRWTLDLDPGYEPGAWRGGGRQRLMRRIEVSTLSGRALSWWQANSPATESPVRAVVIVLDRPRVDLYARIDQRVNDMVDTGLVAEVGRLLEAGYTPTDPGMSATGYGEFIPVVRAERSIDEAVRLTQSATRRYARRQSTWFRNQTAGAIRVDATRPPDELCSTVIHEWKGVAP
jgi:tRNA dimethylallyltransferase